MCVSEKVKRRKKIIYEFRSIFLLVKSSSISLVDIVLVEISAGGGSECGDNFKLCKLIN